MCNGYISCTFPALFPVGKADWDARKKNVFQFEYFKYLVVYKDDSCRTASVLDFSFLVILYVRLA